MACVRVSPLKCGRARVIPDVRATLVIPAYLLSQSKNLKIESIEFRDRKTHFCRVCSPHKKDGNFKETLSGLQLEPSLK